MGEGGRGEREHINMYRAKTFILECGFWTLFEKNIALLEVCAIIWERPNPAVTR